MAILKAATARYLALFFAVISFVSLLFLRAFQPREARALTLEEVASEPVKDEWKPDSGRTILAGSSCYNQSTYYAYGQSSYYAYGQSAYYAQSTYYAQATYQTTFTKNVAATKNFTVTGAIYKGSGSFVIDHPLDPLNKLLYHSFVESPDVKNIYDGVATLDASGEVVVTLPAYFETLNRDYRYQLQGLDAPSPDLYVKQEVAGNRFTIGGGAPRSRVSWQVTGTRQDPYIKKHPIIPEVRKGKDQLVDIGEYVYAEGYGTRGVASIRTPFIGFWSAIERLLRGNGGN